MLTSEQRERYSRQLLLSGMGEQGQLRLLGAKVLVVGAGGLGCPVLQYLAAAGVGTIGIIDGDVVSLSNLHRQILYSSEDIGKPKVLVAFEQLQHLNNDVQYRLYHYTLQPANAWNIIIQYDIVVDGSDNFSTRYLVNDACVLLNKPLVYGSIYKFEGQVSVFNHRGSANYRDLFPNPPAAGEVPDCAEAGVLGVLPGIIGSLMANEVIKIVTGTGTVLAGKLLMYQSLNNSFYEIEYIKSGAKASGLPNDRHQMEAGDYTLVCSTIDADEIDATEFNRLLQQANIPVYDVREAGEEPLVTEFEHTLLPLSFIRANEVVLTDEAAILFCQTGVRSREAANLLRQANPRLLKIFNLKSGILQWKNQHNKAK